MLLFRNKNIKKYFYIGIFLDLLGLFILLFANSRADNWAGYLSPPIILSGLFFFGYSLYLEDNEKVDK